MTDRTQGVQSLIPLLLLASSGRGKAGDILLHDQWKIMSADSVYHIPIIQF